MADANTTRYGFVKPEVGASADTWGAKLNTDFDDIDAIAGAITTTGSANAYVLTTGLSLAAYVAGQTFWIKANFSNTGAATINVDTLGAKDLRKNGTTALASGDIVSGNIYAISYDGTLFQVIGPVTTQHQPLDATLTALAQLSYTSGTLYLTMTAADTFALADAATLVKTSGAQTIAGSKTFTDDMILNQNSGSLPSPVAGALIQLGEADGTALVVELETFAAASNFIVRRANGTNASKSALASGDQVFAFAGRGYGATGYSGGTRGQFSMHASESWTDSAQGMHGRLGGTPAGGTSFNGDMYRWADVTSAKELGFRGLGTPAAPDAAYDFAQSDNGQAVDHTSGSAHTYRVRTNANVAYAPGCVLTGTNTGAGALTIGRESGVVFRNQVGTDADLTVAQYQSYTVRRISSDLWTARVW